MTRAPQTGQPMRMLVLDAEGRPVAAVEVTTVDEELAHQLEALRGAREDAVASLENVGRGIAETCRQIMQSIRDDMGAMLPDELELTFGVTVSAEGGIPLISKASGEATIEVRAQWAHERRNRTD